MARLISDKYKEWERECDSGVKANYDKLQTARDGKRYQVLGKYDFIAMLQGMWYNGIEQGKREGVAPWRDLA